MDCNNCLQIPHIVCVFWREWYSQGGKGSVLKVLGQILQECLGMGGSSMGNQAVVGKPNGWNLSGLGVDLSRAWYGLSASSQNTTVTAASFLGSHD